MPIYEYRCTKCEKEFEYQQRMVDPPKTVCEACGGELERLISRTAFQLKGSGWYKDLYSSAKPEAKSADGGGGGGEAKSDPKPAESKPAESKGDKGGGDKGSGSSSGGSGTGTGTGGGGGGTSATAAA
jgi:putative FmdB family regulatory protein